MADRDDYEPDEQDQSEAFDEDNFDAADAGSDSSDFKTLEEIPDVFDVTSAVGDSGEEDEDEESDQVDLDDELAADGVLPEADELYGADTPRISVSDAESDGQRADDEVELVYTGLMRNVKGAQASAAHWESKRLSDDDLDELGYQGQEPAE